MPADRQPKWQWKSWEIDLLKYVQDNVDTDRVNGQQIRAGVAQLVGRRHLAIAQAQAALKHQWTAEDDDVIYDGLARGWTNKKIADQLGVSTTHVAIRALQITGE